MGSVPGENEFGSREPRVRTGSELHSEWLLPVLRGSGEGTRRARLLQLRRATGMHAGAGGMLALHRALLRAVLRERRLRRAIGSGQPRARHQDARLVETGPRRSSGLRL